jgi:hypothetical protein
MFCLRVGAWALLCSVTLPRIVLANLGEVGFGSRTSSLAGAGVSWGQGGYSAYSNPAALALPTGKRFQFSYGWQWMDPRFKPIENVTLENSYTSDRAISDDRIGNVNEDYRSVLGQAIGAAFVLNPEWRNLSAGITLYSPFDQLGFTDTGETYIPEYVLYRARNQRPQIELGLGLQATDQLQFGLGLHVAFGISANGTVFLQAEDGKPSTMRVTASIKPKASPSLGWLWKEETWSLGQVLRLPNAASSELTFNSSARAFGNLAALDIRFSALSALFYDPASLETGWSWQYSPVHRLLLQLDFQAWRSFQAPLLTIREPEDTCTIDPGGGSCSNLIVSPSYPPAYPLQNILIPRIAQEWSLRRLNVRAGYGYRPSIFSALPTGTGNYLDPPRHMISLGAGWRLEELLGIQAPFELDVHVLFHQLVTQKIEKTPTTEAGDPGTKIGAPGYSAGGQVWGSGISLSMAL